MAYIDRIGEWLSLKEAAPLRGVAKSTVIAWTKNEANLLPSLMTGLGVLVHEEDLKKYQPNRQGPIGPRRKKCTDILIR